MDGMKPGTRQHGPATCKLSFNTTIPANMRGAVLELSHLIVPDQHRKQGYGSMLMQKVCAEADEAAKVLLLMPKPYDTPAMDKDTLIDWYSSFGFEPVQSSPVIMARRPGSVSRVKMKPLAFAMGLH